jgi:Flp pilus assembly protein TadD
MAVESAQIVGATCFSLLLLGGVCWCATAMRRPRTSRTGMVALMLFLLGWGSSGLVRLGCALLGAPESVRRLVNLGLTALLLLAGLVVGIVALATYDRRRFDHGRAQALWAVALCGLFFVAILAAAVHGVVTSTSSESRAQVEAPGRMELPELNFALDPPAGWFTLEAASINRDACIALRLAGADVMCIVIAERGAEGLELPALKEIVRSTLRGNGSVIEEREDSLDIGGLPFVHLISHTRVSGTELLFEHWLTTRRGYAWQVVVWGAPHEAARLGAESRRLIETFEILDPTADGTSVPLADLHSTRHGYSTTLADLGWGAWESVEERHPLLDFGARRSHEALFVLPVRSERELPGLDVLRPVFLDALGIETRGSFDEQTWEPGAGWDGIQLVGIDEDDDGTRFEYRVRIARSQRSALALAGRAEVGRGDAELVRRSLDAIRIFEPHGDASESPARAEALGLFWNEIGRIHADRGDADAAATWFTQALALRRDEPVVLLNAGSSLEVAGRCEEGRALLAPAVPRFPSDAQLASCLARLELGCGAPDGGSQIFLDLVARGLASDELTREWVALLGESGRHDLALTAADAWLQREATHEARTVRAGALIAAGRGAEAVAELDGLRAEAMSSPRVAVDVGHLYNQAGSYTLAAAVAEELLDRGERHDDALMVLGWSHMGRQSFREAMQAFERVAERHPGDPEVAEALRLAAGMLGVGDQGATREPLQLVGIPEDVQRELSAHSLPAGWSDDHHAFWLLDVTGIELEPGRPLRRTWHGRVRVLTWEGAAEWNSLEVDFDPLVERIHANRLVVRDERGRELGEDLTAQAYVRDMDAGVADQRKVLHLPIAGLKPGHEIEWQITWESRAPVDELPFSRHIFAHVLPVAAEAVFVSGPVDDVRAVLEQGKSLQTIRRPGLAAWISPPRRADRMEPLAVWVEHSYPMLWLGSGTADWPALALEYLAEIAERLETGPGVAELAERLVAGVDDPRARAAALVRHVQRELSYQALEFGVRARRPNRDVETLELGYGDCKDLALLLHHLLGAAGIESHLALVSTSWLVETSLPSLDQFDHMVVHVPALGPDWLADPTEDFVDAEALPAPVSWRSHALVLDPARPRLIAPAGTLPEYGWEVTSLRTVTGTHAGWNVAETLTLRGYAAASVRGTLAGLSEPDRLLAVQSLLSGYGSPRIGAVRLDAAGEVRGPATLHLEYVVPRTAPDRASAVPAAWERSELDVPVLEERRTDFEWLRPTRIDSRVTVTLPGPVDAAVLAELRREATSEFCTWSLRAERTETRPAEEVDLVFAFQAHPGRHAAARYAEFLAAWEAAARAWDAPVRWSQR